MRCEQGVESRGERAPAQHLPSHLLCDHGATFEDKDAGGGRGEDDSSTIADAALARDLQSVDRPPAGSREVAGALREEVSHRHRARVVLGLNLGPPLRRAEDRRRQIRALYVWRWRARPQAKAREASGGELLRRRTLGPRGERVVILLFRLVCV